MGSLDLTFVGRLDPLEAASVLALVGAACAGDRVARTGIAVRRTDENWAAAVHLMEMRGIRRTADGEDRFPVAVTAGERRETGLLAVELHPMMRDPGALAALVGHLVGGTPGRLVRRLWGRWNETVCEPTEQMMESVDAGHMRFPQFMEDVLKTGLARAASVAGVRIDVTTERNGRGAKVIRVALAVGCAPAWLVPNLGQDRDGEQQDPGGVRLPADDRAAFYGIVRAGLRGGQFPRGVGATVAEWLAGSDDESDRRIAAAAVECSERRSYSPVATGMEKLLLSQSDVAMGLRVLSRKPWPDGVAGPLASRAWILRAAACMAASGNAPDTAMLALRGALDGDERAGIVSAEDAAPMRGLLGALLETIRDPSPAPDRRDGLLVRRDRLRIRLAGDAAALSRCLLGMAEEADGVQV